MNRQFWSFGAVLLVAIPVALILWPGKSESATISSASPARATILTTADLPSNLSTGIWLYEEFYCPPPPLTSGTTANFVYSSSGTQAGVIRGRSVPKHTGIAILWTGNTATGSALVSSNDDGYGFQPADGVIEYECEIQLQQLQTTADQFTLYVGMHDASTSWPINGLWFSYGNPTSPNWIANSASSNLGAGSLQVDTGVPVTTNWVRLGITTNAAGTSATYYINGTAVTTISGGALNGIPTMMYGPRFNLEKQVGTTPMQLYLDAVAVSQRFHTPR